MTSRTVKDKSTPPFVQIDVRLITALTNAEFKIYAQIKRRAGEDGECWSSLENMAKETKNSVSTLQRSLKTLKKMGLIAKIRRPGETDVYELTPPEKWHLSSQNDRPNIGQNDLGVRSKRPEGFGQNDRPNIGQNDLLNRSLIELDPIELDPQKNKRDLVLPTHFLDAREEPESVREEIRPINALNSEGNKQCSAPPPVFGATRRISNLEKQPSDWVPRWRTGMGPNQWHEGFADWLTSNMFSGAKRSRGDVVAYLRKREADPTGAARQDLEAKFDDYEQSWAARTGNAADSEWKEMSKLLTHVMEKKDVA
jgi:DNA-binding transcriptional ArsR family regulator